jgi:hypothetical protein
VRSYCSIGNISSIIGVITMLLGTIFLLQSKSIIGPTSSFMYRNPDWTGNGYFTILIGIMLLAIGIVLKVASR